MNIYVPDCMYTTKRLNVVRPDLNFVDAGGKVRAVGISGTRTEIISDFECGRQ